MRQSNPKISKHIMTMAALSLCFVAGCKQGDGIELGYIENEQGAHSVDTFTVAASTLLWDPLPTAGRAMTWGGNTGDEDLGTLTSSSYFRLSSSDLSVGNLPADASYDSLSIRLLYNGYSYGDTTKAMRLSLHRVTEDMELTELSVALEDDEYPVFVSS